MPAIPLWRIFNFSFSLFAIQLCYALETGNASRILGALGFSDLELNYFWLAAPSIGLIMQPIIGRYSDNLWCRFGRRIPVFMVSVIISLIAITIIPYAQHTTPLSHLIILYVFLFFLLDISLNLAFQPLTALIGDMLPDHQVTYGYSMQTILINLGAIIGSLLPFLLTRWGVPNLAIKDNKIADSIIWSLYIGAIILIISLFYTLLTVKEYTPNVYSNYHKSDSFLKKSSIQSFITNIPNIVWNLMIVGFLSWSAFFIMWIYMTPGIAEVIWHTKATDKVSIYYKTASNWSGLLFAIYNFIAMIFALFIPKLVTKIKIKTIYCLSLLIGAISLLSIIFIANKYSLIFAMVGIGIAWSSILSIPYTILSKSVPTILLGTYLGVYNMAILLAQIFIGLFGGVILFMLGGTSIYMFLIAALLMFIASISINN